ncbi:MAG: trypsin-like peptidase domain-containing protein, partial [SAR324 cluster bacterium]|nr:trypsin-like peptidase domain-containing protein [SAR324 cluster bacterium]
MFSNRHIFLFLFISFYFTQVNGVTRYTVDEQENISIYEKSSRAVVNISNISVNYDFYYRAIPAESGSGTGFLINKAGIIITNYLVVENASKLVVTLADNSQWPGKLVGADPNNDLAIVRIEAPAESYDVLKFSHS